MMEGVSRSTFGKPHMRDLLVRCGIVEAKATITEDTAAKEPSSAAKWLRTELKRKDERIAKLRNENAELSQECELLRERLFLLMQRANLK